MSDLMIYGLIVLLLGVGCYQTAPVWWFYKTKQLKRSLWVAFGRCPRCNHPVNFDRNGRALCPNCGKSC